MLRRQIAFLRLSAIAALAALVLAACAGSPRAQAGDAISPVVISLKSSATVEGEVLRIGDIAELHGGNSALRQKISELDILDAPAQGESSDVTRSLIGIRLKLAGIEDDQCRFDGANTVRVCSRDAESTANVIVTDAIRRQLAERLAVEPDELDVNLVDPVPERWADMGTRRLEDIRVSIPPNAQLGRVRMKVALLRGERAEDSAPIVVEAQLLQTMYRTVRSVDRGAVLAEEDVRVEHVPTTRRTGATSAADVLGKKMRRSLPSGTVIQSHDLENGGKSDNPILVKPRDIVRLVVRKPGLSVTMSAAEVLQSGRRGDTVQVRNTLSKKIITGRVLSESEVEVPL